MSERDAVEELLSARGAVYGEFEALARTAQQLKAIVQEQGALLESDQREALEMICTKIARILRGDPRHVDSWVDIAGYAMLVAQRLRARE